MGVISPGTFDGPASPPGHDEERAAEAALTEGGQRRRSPGTVAGRADLPDEAGCLLLSLQERSPHSPQWPAVASRSTFPPPDV